MQKVQEVVNHLMATSAFSLQTSGIRSFTSSSTSGWYFSFSLAFLKLSTASSLFSADTSGRVKLLYKDEFLRPIYRNHFEKWEGKSGHFWTDYSDWMFNKFVLKNCNPVIRDAIRKNVEENLTKRIISQNSGNSISKTDWFHQPDQFDIFITYTLLCYCILTFVWPIYTCWKWNTGWMTFLSVIV